MIVTGNDLGPVYTPGDSFRARAEARQREYRANVLAAGWSTHGHMLDAAAADAGANFASPEAFSAARDRRDHGKGVAQRTFNNMLSSQAMCFNVFAPLAIDLTLASTVLRSFWPPLRSVGRIYFEYTPSNEMFRDQTGRGGVDCDLLMEGVWADGEKVVIVVETKFVEQEFSSCGFRDPGREKQGRAVCPSDVVLAGDCSACLYSNRKNYRYWDRTWETGNVRRDAIPESGCPFGGPLWQLWVNHTLAHVEARERGAKHALFAVCAPAGNEALLRGGEILREFQGCVTDPATVLHISVDRLVEEIHKHAAGGSAAVWADAISARYCAI